jgi:hypothetical protein
MAVALGACSDAALTPPKAAGTSAPAAPIPVASVALSPTALTLLPNTGQGVFVRLLGSDGRVLLDRDVTWASSDSNVAIAGPMYSTGTNASSAPNARVEAGHAGTAIVTAAVDGKTASIVITVVGATASQSVIAVESFTVVELQPRPGFWSYAPQVRMKDPTGSHSGEVIGFDLSIPGFGQAPPCRMSVLVGQGASVDLFHEIYGDYELTYVNSGARASGTVATAFITVRDDSGTVALLTVPGPIVPGQGPTTYTGGTSQSGLSCG